MSLIERIDEIRANSVSGVEFKEMWGISIDDCVKQMMEFVKKFDAEHGI